MTVYCLNSSQKSSLQAHLGSEPKFGYTETDLYYIEDWIWSRAQLDFPVLTSYDLAANSTSQSEPPDEDTEGESQNQTRKLFQTSGRFELYKKQDWSCWSDLSYGFNFHDWDTKYTESGEPPFSVGMTGLLFPAGAKLKKIYIKGCASSNNVNNLEFFVRVFDTDFTAGLPLDSTSEMGAVTLAGGIITANLNSGSGNDSDVQIIEIDLQDYIMNNNGDLHLYCRAANWLTSTYRYTCSVTVEYEL